MENETSGDFRDLGGPIFLVNVRNEHEANIVESILSAEGIPLLRKHKYAGSYLNIQMGMSDYGMDIFVPETCVELAKVLIETEPEDSEFNDEAQEIDHEVVGFDEEATASDYNLEFQDKMRTRAIILISLVWGIPLVIWIITTIFNRSG